jgi:hypothetical protein
LWSCAEFDELFKHRNRWELLKADRPGRLLFDPSWFRYDSKTGSDANWMTAKEAMKDHPKSVLTYLYDLLNNVPKKAARKSKIDKIRRALDQLDSLPESKMAAARGFRLQRNKLEKLLGW